MRRSTHDSAGVRESAADASRPRGVLGAAPARHRVPTLGAHDRRLDGTRQVRVEFRRTASRAQHLARAIAPRDRHGARHGGEPSAVVGAADRRDEARILHARVRAAARAGACVHALVDSPERRARVASAAGRHGAEVPRAARAHRRACARRAELLDGARHAGERRDSRAPRIGCAGVRRARVRRRRATVDRARQRAVSAASCRDEHSDERARERTARQATPSSVRPLAHENLRARGRNVAQGAGPGNPRPA